jgi:hypothetical protein
MMEGTVSVLRRAELGADGTRVTPETRVLTVKAVYALSENGRKLSLLDGGDGRAEQILDVRVPRNRLHLVTVDSEGNARLKLCPRYDVRPDGRVVKVETSPVYDQPPTIDDLFLAASKNHELEAAYLAQRQDRLGRSDAQQDLRGVIAQEFLANPEQRAAEHPAPSPKRCYLLSGGRRLLFDATRDQGVAKQVPAEAHRRFRADERARRETNQQEHARRQRVHEDKKRFVSDWIDTNGTAELRERQDAGLLPMADAIDAIADHAFAALSNWPLYKRNGAELLQAFLRQHAEYGDAVISERELQIIDGDAPDATAAQWAQVKEARALVPGATVTIRSHRLEWKRNPKAPSLVVRGLLLVQHVGPLVVRREFAVEDAFGQTNFTVDFDKER